MTIPAPRKITEDDFLTIPEIFYMADIPRNTLEQWRVRDQFMPEDDSIGYTPVWRLARVLAFFETEKRHRADGTLITCNEKKWRKRRDAGGFRRQADLAAKRKQATASK